MENKQKHINKKWNINSPLNDNNVPQMYVQDAQNNAPDTSISQNTATVNSNILQNLVNNSLYDTKKESTNARSATVLNNTKPDTSETIPAILSDPSISQNTPTVNSNILQNLVNKVKIRLKNVGTSEIVSNGVMTTVRNIEVPASGDIQRVLNIASTIP